MSGARFCCIVLSVVATATCMNIYLELNKPTTKEELQFLKNYGYLPEEPASDVEFSYTPHSIAEALTKMQAFAGLPATGVLDAETRKLFTKKRCGVRDIDNTPRQRRYILRDSWGKKDITYKVINGSSTVSRERVEAVITTALSMWAEHGKLSFNKVEGKADIEVSFVTGDHGDGSAFDGRGMVVAHAFPPPVGDAHFDDDELWTDNPDDENEDVTDLFAAAIHELGHSLGLSHSNNRDSIMYPYYQTPVDELGRDDILAIQALYSQFSSPPRRARPAPAPPAPAPSAARPADDDLPDLCYTNYDTIQVLQGKIYVFEEEWVWVFTERNQLEEGYPKRIHSVFRGLPKSMTSVRTIYENLLGEIVLFAGKRYWHFDSRFHLIKKGKLFNYFETRHLPELTTVFLSNYNNKTYLIEYERFWRFDESTGTMDPGYPKEMSAWRDLPYPVDAAIIWKGDTYFFRGPRFWRFDNKQIRAHPYYPLMTAQIWFNCEPTPEMNNYEVNDLL